MKKEIEIPDGYSLGEFEIIEKDNEKSLVIPLLKEKEEIPKEGVACTECNIIPKLVDYSYALSFQVFYSMKCKCKQTPWHRNSSYVIKQWEEKYFNMNSKKVFKELKSESDDDLLGYLP